MNKRLVSIGIPTYGRKKCICSSIIDLLEDDLLETLGINVLVIDNNSEDGTYQAIRHILNSYKSTNIRCMKNARNIGVYPSIYRLFKECRSEYLLITSDEDFVVKSSLPRLIKFLETIRPTFVSTQVIRAGNLYRGSLTTRRLDVAEWESSSFYISGLIYHVETILEIWKDVGELFFSPYLFYVQSLLVAELMVLCPKSQYFVDFAVTEKRFELNTAIGTSKGGDYNTIGSRWEQCKAIDEYFLKRQISLHKNIDVSLYNAFRRTNISTLFQLFVNCIRAERPEYLSDFIGGARSALNLG